jgi:hypothetical protein
VSACKRVGPAAGLGTLFLLATPIAAIFVCITIVGLPVGFSTLILYVISLYSAQIFVGAWLGGKILGMGTGFAAMLGRMALGLAIIRALSLLPFLGGLVMAIVVIWGLGALALTIYHRLRPPQLAAA